MDAESRNCKNCKVQFAVTLDDVSFYEKIAVPAPTWCPECRQKRRLIFRNFKTFYRRPSDKSGKPLVSMYPENTPFPVWSSEEWWADDWDAKLFGRDFDFSRPFFDQFKELLFAVPRYNVMNNQSVNCEYSNMVKSSKNCYLVFGCVDNEDCAYGHIVWESKDSLDGLYLYKCEFCYECSDCLTSYKLMYSQECESCTESVGLYDCRSCINCIGCVGLKQKSYYIFNENVGKEGYEAFLKEHPLSDPATIPFILERQAELRKTLPQRHFFGTHNNDVSGNHIYNAKNVHDSFDVKIGENSKFIYTGRKIIDSYDITFGVDMELQYECMTSGGSRTAFAHLCTGASHVYYSDASPNSRNIFGCAGLKSGEYCILNKQYSKEEYEALVQKIIAHMKTTGEWGEFFPPSLSTFAYNESVIQEYFPLTREEALAQGYRWLDELPMTVGKETIQHDQLPQNPVDYLDDLLQHILKCSHCGRSYRFISKEISFYKELGLPLPKECFNCRHARRMALRTPRKLFDGQCAKCGKNIKTAYPPEQQAMYKIYCEQCYQRETA